MFVVGLQCVPLECIYTPDLIPENPSLFPLEPLDIRHPIIKFRVAFELNLPSVIKFGQLYLCGHWLLSRTSVAPANA